MLQAGWLKQMPGYLICILAFFIPFPFIFSSVSIIVLVGFWLVQVNFRELASNLVHRKLLWPWIVFYLLHAVSYLYSENKQGSAFDLQVKLSIIILPIVIGTGYISLKQFSKILLAFASGIAAIAMFCFIRSFKIWLDTGFTPIFFYHNLVNGLDANAIYMSWYALLSISSLLLFPWGKYYKTQLLYIRKPLLLILSAFVILLSSRLLIALFFVVTIPVFLYTQTLKTKVTTGKVVLVGSIFLAMILLVFTTKNPIKQRYDDILHKNFSLAWQNDYSKVEDSSFNNLTLRVFIWRVGFENIKQHNLLPYGAGNGDVTLLQNAKMAEYKVRNMNSNDPNAKSNLQNINTHNMFLQSLMMLGIPGLLTFLLMMICPFLYFNNIGEGKYIYLIFNIISFLFMMQESALQSQAGVVFFSLFSMIFYSISYSLTSDNRLKNN
jgi:O-antigen ligase